MHDYVRKSVQDNGRTFSYVEMGDRKNPAILFLHGLGSTSLSFYETMSYLDEDYFCVSLDLPCHGHSDRITPEELLYPKLTKLIHRIVEKIGLKRYYLVCHSLGGAIGMLYGPDYFSEIIQMVLLDGGYYHNELAYKYAKKHKEAILFESLREEMDYYKNDMDNAKYKDYDELISIEGKIYPIINEYAKEALIDLGKWDGKRINYHLDGNDAQGYIVFSWTSTGLSLSKDYSHFPILLIGATIPKCNEEIRLMEIEEFKEKTNGSVVRLEGLSHALHFENPKLISELIRKWLINS